ncbi:hypothetical protein [Bacillus tuaregi]|uniref:hypothetical protein n=1 Tax=Bacillus tuaregi TaxID=1816695 RepID=UPI0008F90791|nr:hypothetical protein [Bacillus tuaregi]
MIHINFGQWIKELLYNFRDNVTILLVFIFLFPVLIFLYLMWRITNTILPYGVGASLADCFVFVTDKFFFALLIVPMSVYLLQYLNKNDFNILFILRQKSRKILWTKHMFRTFIFSSLVTTYFTICTFIIGGFFSTSYINWNSISSIYYLANNKVTDNVSILNVLVMFLIFCILLLTILNMLFQLLQWITNGYLFGWLVILSIGIWDMFQRTYAVMYGKLTISHSIWERSGYMNISIMYGIFVGLVIFIIGIVAVKRKDFLNEVG